MHFHSYLLYCFFINSTDYVKCMIIFSSNNLILEYKKKKEYKKVLSTCGQPQFNAMHLYAIYYMLYVVCLDVMW